MTRVYRYILVTDAGMAPCVARGVISLATCKPAIRRSARYGDWVIGYMPARFGRGLICWAGRVQSVVPVGQYQREHRARPDAVYRENDDGSFARLRPGYHDDADQMRKDLSGPVLVFDPSQSWYFGSSPRQPPEQLAHLAASGIGHRVNGVRDGDADALAAWLAEVPPGVHGEPRDDASGSASGGRCHPPRSRTSRKLCSDC